MIYQVAKKVQDKPSQEFIGPYHNVMYVTLGQVRKHRYHDNEYFVYEMLPEWQNPKTKEITPAEEVWVNFKLAYFNSKEIRSGVEVRDDPTFTEDSLYALESIPLTMDEINELIGEMHLSSSNKKKRTDIKVV